MGRIAIVTDSNSGITREEAAALGAYVVPMPFFIDGELYYEGITLTTQEFYKRMAAGSEISTSQPTPGAVLELWDELLETNDEVVYIPMSSGLSGSCATATALAEDYDGRVHVVDNQRISATQRQSVIDALNMARDGLSGAQITEVLLRERLEASIYITVDTLQYLKKGGRITAAGAADTGRQARRLLHGSRAEGRQAPDARRGGARFGEALLRQARRHGRRRLHLLRGRGRGLE